VVVALLMIADYAHSHRLPAEAHAGRVEKSPL